MKPIEVVTGRSTWPALLALLEQPGRKVVASAFIGSDGATLLRTMGKGDLLVCNASDSSLKQGSTYPHALRTLVARGVTVRSRGDLHAKIYVVGNRAFIGSANVSQASTNLEEAGVFVDDEDEAARLASYIEGLATSSDADKVGWSFLERADRTFKRPRAIVGHSPVAKKPGGEPLWFCSFGDLSAPSSVETAAESHRDDYVLGETDAAASYEWSWGTRGTWRVGATCVWVERDGADPELWWAQPPSRCVDAYPVGGRSKQWIYWWRTPAVKDLPWGKVRAHVLAACGRSISLEQSSLDAHIRAEIDRLFGIEQPIKHE